MIEDEGGNNFLEQSSEIICLVGVCGLVWLFSLALGSLLQGCLTGNEVGSSVPLYRNIVTLENDCMEIHYDANQTIMSISIIAMATVFWFLFFISLVFLFVLSYLFMLCIYML